MMTALEYATEKHKGQKRKDGKDYITHPIAVRDIALKIAVGVWTLQKDKLEKLFISEGIFLRVVSNASLLHDTVEDTDATLEDIIEKVYDGHYPFSKSVIDAVDALTKRKGENYLEAIIRVKGNIIAKIVKMADLTHNMSDLNEGSLKDKYRLAYYILLNDI